MYLFGVWILLLDWLARWSFRVTGGGAEPALQESIERERKGRRDSPSDALRRGELRPG